LKIGVKILCPPLTDSQVENLRAGDEVRINGVIYTARDAAHKKLAELIEKGGRLPFDPKGQIIYYMGPTPARPGRVIGAAGPTTSYRMDKYTSLMLKQGIKAVIGKGKRSAEVKKSLQQFKAIYLVTVGGVGALLSRHIVTSESIAYKELGPEAIYKLEVTDFPAFVCYDAWGNDLYEEGQKKYRKD